jgi:hypothetical protein
MARSGRAFILTLRTVALIAAVLVGTALGGWRAVSMAATRPDPSTLVVNGVSYAVTHVEQVKGLSDSELGGMAHGVQSLVSADKAMVTVTLVVTAGDSPTSFDASVLRAFETGSSAGIPPAGGTLSPGRLSSHAQVEGSLSFIASRNGAQLTLRAPGDPREVPLLQLDQSASGDGSHPHPSATPATGRTSPSARP